MTAVEQVEDAILSLVVLVGLAEDHLVAVLGKHLLDSSDDEVPGVGVKVGDDDSDDAAAARLQAAGDLIRMATHRLDGGEGPTAQLSPDEALAGEDCPNGSLRYAGCAGNVATGQHETPPWGTERGAST